MQRTRHLAAFRISENFWRTRLRSTPRGQASLGYATGANGFFGSDTIPLDLTIVSGGGGSESPITVSYDTGSSGQPNYYATDGGPVSFNLPQAVPEPGSLVLFGTAPLGLSAVRRRRRGFA